MLLVFIITLSLAIMLAQYRYDLIASISAGNILMFGILILQIVAIDVQLKIWRDQYSKALLYVNVFLYGAGCGLFWSGCVGYSEGLTMLNINYVDIINLIIFSIICGGTCIFIASFFAKTK